MLNCLDGSFEKVIEATTEKSKTSCMYKESILRGILKITLNGNYQTYIIASIYPNDDEPDEILKTIKLASMARRISKNLVINGYFHNEVVDLLKEEIFSLEQEIVDSRRTNTCIYSK